MQRYLKFSVMIATILISMSALTESIAQQPSAEQTGEQTIRVMTLNMDEGTNYRELVAARSPEEFAAAVSATYQNIQATKPAERAAAIARQIAAERADLVGLQEASIVRTGPSAPATSVQSDLLQSVLDELRALGQPYAAVIVVPDFEAEAPSTLGFDVRLTTRDVILARSGTNPDLAISNVLADHFATNLLVPTPGGAFTLQRGWAAIDVKVRGRNIRFVTTHLDNAPQVQLAQAKELVQTAASTASPVILVGDFNAAANDAADATFPTYQGVVDSGFVDAWRQAHPSVPGFTCCQAADLRNQNSTLSQRIDLVLFRGAFRIDEAHLIGSDQADRMALGMWPSDHAGVVATLRIP